LLKTLKTAAGAINELMTSIFGHICSGRRAPGADPPPGVVDRLYAPAASSPAAAGHGPFLLMTTLALLNHGQSRRWRAGGARPHHVQLNGDAS
jgi:hypothetical protein